MTQSLILHLLLFLNEEALDTWLNHELQPKHDVGSCLLNPLGLQPPGVQQDSVHWGQPPLICLLLLYQSCPNNCKVVIETVVQEYLGQDIAV